MIYTAANIPSSSRGERLCVWLRLGLQSLRRSLGWAASLQTSQAPTREHHQCSSEEATQTDDKTVANKPQSSESTKDSAASQTSIIYSLCLSGKEATRKLIRHKIFRERQILKCTRFLRDAFEKNIFFLFCKETKFCSCQFNVNHSFKKVSLIT